jgi:hypothetical protein
MTAQPVRLQTTPVRPFTEVGYVLLLRGQGAFIIHSLARGRRHRSTRAGHNPLLHRTSLIPVAEGELVIPPVAEEAVVAAAGEDIPPAVAVVVVVVGLTNSAGLKA